MDVSELRATTSGRDSQTSAIIAAAIEVQRELGTGFLEPVYQQALAKEFARAGVPFQRELLLPISYKGERLDCAYKADFVCFSSIIVELKALARLSGAEQSQVMNYLKATGLGRADPQLRRDPHSVQTCRLMTFCEFCVFCG